MVQTPRSIAWSVDSDWTIWISEPLVGAILHACKLVNYKLVTISLDRSKVLHFSKIQDYFFEAKRQRSRVNWDGDDLNLKSLWWNCQKLLEKKNWKTIFFLFFLWRRNRRWWRRWLVDFLTHSRPWLRLPCIFTLTKTWWLREGGSVFYELSSNPFDYQMCVRKGEHKS